MTSVLYRRCVSQRFMSSLAILSIAALLGCQPGTATQRNEGRRAEQSAAPKSAKDAAIKEPPPLEKAKKPPAEVPSRIFPASRRRCKRCPIRRAKEPERQGTPARIARTPAKDGRSRSGPLEVTVVAAQARRESGRRGQGPGRHEAIHREARHRREVRHGADSRRNVQDGQPAERKGSQGRRGAAGRGQDRAVLDGQVRSHLEPVRVVGMGLDKQRRKAQADRRRPTGTRPPTPWRFPPNPIPT